MTLKNLFELQSLLAEKAALEKSFDEKNLKLLKMTKQKILEEEKTLLVQEKALQELEKALAREESTLNYEEKAINNLEEELYTNSNYSPKELENLQNRIGSLKENLNIQTDGVLLSSDELEEKKKSFLQYKKEFRTLVNNYKLAVQKYKDEKSAHEMEVMLISSKIEDLLNELTQSEQNLYRDNYKKYGLPFLSKVSHGNCTACNIKLPFSTLKQLKREESLIKCENCGRILFWE